MVCIFYGYVCVGCAQPTPRYNSNIVESDVKHHKSTYAQSLTTCVHAFQTFCLTKIATAR